MRYLLPQLDKPPAAKYQINCLMADATLAIIRGRWNIRLEEAVFTPEIGWFAHRAIVILIDEMWPVPDNGEF